MIARNDVLSVYGLYNFDDTLFDLMVLPQGMDRRDTIDNLVMECAELEILYPDPDFLKMAIGAWSKKQLPAWEKLYKTEHFDYNPIWNKDGEIVEEFDETRGRKSSSNRSGSEMTNANGEAERTVSAFNEAGYHPAEKNTSNTSDGTATTEKLSANDDETVHHKNTRTERGNIGVTTTQQMINEEREVDKFLTMDAIIGDFKRRFCLLIY